MLTKLFIFIMLAVIVGSLFSALWFLYKDGGKGTRTVKSLTVRITLSIALFVMLLIGYKLGWITPHGIGQ